METQCDNGMLLLIDKPKHISSFGFIWELRKKYRVKKVGHAGTLDPLASGLLIVAIGPATKQLRQYVGLDKVYEAEVCVGEKSATGDAEGPIIEAVHVPMIPKTKIQAVLCSMHGVLRLPVSPYSATKQGGEPLYKKVRRGESPIVPIRDMEVLDARLTKPPQRTGDCIHLFVRFRVSSGTYVRSLAEELGKRLGYPARLENLRRTAIGTHAVENALPLSIRSLKEK